MHLRVERVLDSTLGLKTALARPSSWRTPARVCIQPVEHRIKINLLATFLQPPNDTKYVFTPVAHAHQLLDQLIVEMSTRWALLYVLHSERRGRRIRTLLEMRLWRRLSPSSFTIEHHISISRASPTWNVAVSWWCSVACLAMLCWRLLLNWAGPTRSKPVLNRLGTRSTSLRRPGVWCLHRHVIGSHFCRRLIRQIIRVNNLRRVSNLLLHNGLLRWLILEPLV